MSKTLGKLNRALLMGAVLIGLGADPSQSERAVMSVQHKYEGESQSGSLQEAVMLALQQLDADLREGGVIDASASWTMTEISGKRGGIADSRSVKVKITAKRSPPWSR
jgi:hypothetical protein